jgi:hypothetical protein
MSMALRLILTSICLLYTSSATASRIDLESYASGFDTIPVAVLDFRPVDMPAMTDMDISAVITNDLAFSGRFRVIRTEKPDSALFARNGIGIFIAGEYSRNGTDIVLDCYVHDAMTTELLVGKKYQGDMSHRRSMAHRFSNQIFEMRVC